MRKEVFTIDEYIVTFVDHRNLEQPVIEVKVFTDYDDAEIETAESFQRAFNDCFGSCTDIRVVRRGWEQVSIVDNNTEEVLITIKSERIQIARSVCGTMSM